MPVRTKEMAIDDRNRFRRAKPRSREKTESRNRFFSGGDSIPSRTSCVGVEAWDVVGDAFDISQMKPGLGMIADRRSSVERAWLL